jgi:hypothetical protein
MPLPRGKDSGRITGDPEVIHLAQKRALRRSAALQGLGQLRFGRLRNALRNVKGSPATLELIRLPAHTATMDDCCRLQQLLFGAPTAGPMPLTIGILEIVSTVDLAVTAVYTCGSPK